MLARSQSVHLLGGAISFETPILVPGLSSKALGPLLTEEPGTRTLKLKDASIVHSDTLIQGIEDALLVSAYDIKHQLLTDAGRFNRRFSTSRWSKPNLLIIDSGWYEKSVGPQSGPFVHEAGAALSWEFDDYVATVDAFDPAVRAVLVSWDNHGEYAEQIASAQSFFASRKRFASTILFKPPKKARFHNFKRLSDEDAENVRAFDIVGVTEKELGDSIIERLVELARLRRRLDEAEISSPVHVFGGLDPLYTPLYVAAGAEIFDGLGWLRYSYRDGRAHYRDEAPLIDGPITKRWSVAVSSTQLHNLDEIAHLTEDLKLFVQAGGDPRKFRQSVSTILKPALNVLEGRLKRV